MIYIIPFRELLLNPYHKTIDINRNCIQNVPD